MANITMNLKKRYNLKFKKDHTITEELWVIWENLSSSDIMLLYLEL